MLVNVHNFWRWSSVQQSVSTPGLLHPVCLTRYQVWLTCWKDTGMTPVKVTSSVSSILIVLIMIHTGDWSNFNLEFLVVFSSWFWTQYENTDM